jgi:hypothetical protein
VQVEQKLAKFEAEAQTFPARHRQLTAIRYYLHEVLWTCQKKWSGHHNGITNYLTFLNRLSGLPEDADLMAVSGTISGARDTVNNLAIDNSAGSKRELKATGFSGLIREIDNLEAFLSA